ncbi:hypothetical protein [Nitrospira moscoviensis]|uniref:Uncharacterized protein n=1 Tax=Nitrospira moscoviensis TaxID=42253 RepID=A0A0K2G8L3_NITMO|nr:hypothetical protein [Nitrospira moscoviensis]ALA57316.1 conserved exported protein of unknown function [Nitrospira moscoviensis]
MHSPAVVRTRRLRLPPALCVAVLLPTAGSAWAEGKTDKPFHALTVDAKGVEMEVRHVALPTVTITLADGKRREFPLALAGSFKGQSDFGEVDLPVAELKRLTFK